MRLWQLRYIAFLIQIIILLFLASGCSTQKNTARSRWWHAFNARYNTYYNGTVAYIDASLEKENGHQDNFTELLPLYPVGSKSSRELGKANFERAVEKSKKAIKLHSIKKRPEWRSGKRKTAKDREWLNRKEYNPFLWKAWMLMGRAQFHSGAFDEAVSTFSYMSRLYQTQPSIYGRARAWLAKSYIEQGWLYDAEDVIRNMERDSVHWQAQKEWDYTYTDYYIHTKEYAKAIPYLRKVIKHEMRRRQKARQYFLLGQLYEAINQKELAYQAYRRVIRLHPPYQIEFNARIAMTKVMAGTQGHQMIRKLHRMAANDNNKDYLDQVYYAIGNIYLGQKDTLRAIDAFEEGNKRATRSGIEKGVLLLKLGDLYWNREKYDDAKRCYGEAIGLLDKDREDYAQLARRSEILDELVPYTNAVQLQDSLQVLAQMPEAQRNAAIDGVIKALKKKEKEEADLLAMQSTRQESQDDFNTPFDPQERMTKRNTLPNVNGQRSGEWYFYNPMAVNQGKTAFQRLWGKRENVDNWQRINKTVVSLGQQQELSEVQLDSIRQQESMEDSLQQVPDSAQNDPHQRAFYLAQIPFTPDQVAASNQLIMDGLFHAGVIFKDKLDNLRLGEKALRRLEEQYPTYEHMDLAYYHLFLLYSRLHQLAMANGYVQRLKTQFPKSEWTVLLTDPYFQENAKLGVHIEDSIYAATYNAFKADRYDEVLANTRISETRFPLGANRDKFLFIGGLGKLNRGDATQCLADLHTLVEKYPESKLSPLAGMIINGVQAGRKLRGGKFDIGDVWSRRAAVLSDSDSIAKRTFSNERNTNFTFMIAYHPDSVNENQLLYRVAKYNFTQYVVRNFDVVITKDDFGLHLMKIAGFLNFDEALQYARAFHKQRELASLLKHARTFVISDVNLELLGTNFSYDDYDKYYTKHFAPLKISTFQLLTEPTEVKTQAQPKPTLEEVDRLLDDATFIDNGLEDKPLDSGTYVLPTENDKTSNHQGGTIVPVEQPKKESNSGETVIPLAPRTTSKTPLPADSAKTKSTKQLPMNAKKSPQKVPTQSVQPAKAKPKQVPSKQQPQRVGETIIYFEDGKTAKDKTGKPKTVDKTTDKNKKKKKKAEPKVIDFGDEYYDLEGF